MKKLGYYILLALTSVCLFACSETKKEEPKEEADLGEFVYIDRSKCLHTKKYCMNLIDSGDDGSNKNYQVRFFETKKLTPYDFESICSSCVSDEDFKKLRKTIEQNGYDYEEEVDSVAAY
nr:hypothetical protein [uncultured Prevotella sp.]